MQTPSSSAIARSASAPGVVVSPSAARVTDLERSEEARQVAKVVELQARVEAGTYEVDLDVLAERLADEELARALK